MSAVLTSGLNPAAPEVNPGLGAELNPATAVFYPALRDGHGDHVNGNETRVSRYRIRLLEVAADAGGVGYTLPARPKRKGSIATDVPKKNRNRKKIACPYTSWASQEVVWIFADRFSF